MAPILVWLSLAGVLQPIHNTMGWLFIASGKSRQMFVWGVVASSVLSVGFLAGVRWGALGVAVSYAVLMTFVVTGPALYVAHRAARIPLRGTVAATVGFLVRAVVMGGVVLGTGILLVEMRVDWLPRLTAKVGVGVVAYLWLCRGKLPLQPDGWRAALAAET